MNVLILVVVEDVLVLCTRTPIHQTNLVLILVVVEDVLVLLVCQNTTVKEKKS